MKGAPGNLQAMCSPTSGWPQMGIFFPSVSLLYAMLMSEMRARVGFFVLRHYELGILNAFYMTLLRWTHLEFGKVET